MEIDDQAPQEPQIPLLRPKVQELINRVEKNSQGSQQVIAFEQAASSLQVAALALDKAESNNAEQLGAINQLTTRVSEVLENLSNVKTPEIPDYAAPVVDALDQLQAELKKSVGKINVKPEFKPNISVASPDVTVPEVNLGGVERLLKNEVPKAFEKAIKSIPKPDIPTYDDKEVVDILKILSEQLESIDTATRIKPQFPSTLKVTNVDGSAVGGSSNALTDAQLRASDVEVAEQFMPLYEDNVNAVAAVTQKPVASSTYSFLPFVDFGTVTSLLVKSSAGVLGSVSVSNVNAAVRYLQVHNRATAAIATNVPIMSWEIPAGSASAPATVVLGQDYFGPNGLYLSTGISIAVSTTKGTYTAATASDHTINGTRF